MSLSEAIFQKDIYRLSITDLLSFFATEQEETSMLEFKSGDVSLEGVYREVSAFLNTEGGLLIIGSPKEKTVTTNSGLKKVCQGELSASKIQGQDSLLRSIASNISPAPYGIKAKEFDYQSGKIFVLEIAQSITPPHQVSNEGKYYIRLEREAKAAPHGIVEALFYKRQKPMLDADIRAYAYVDNETSTFVQITLLNESLVTAEHVGFIIKIKGVLRLIHSENTNKKIEVKNNEIEYKDALSNILVKGIALNYTFEVEAKTKIILIECHYWCKDLQAEYKIGTYENGVGEFTKSVNSKRLNTTADELKEVYDYFQRTMNESN